MSPALKTLLSTLAVISFLAATGCSPFCIGLAFAICYLTNRQPVID
jgi:hypothetical protein